MPLIGYLRLWLACLRYSAVRALMFRFDFIMWALVELFWMGVNLLMVSVIYSHTSEIGGWNRPQMLLLLGTSMLTQRLLMGFFWSNLFEMGRNIRSGTFDFFLAQPGNPLFMVSTRKVDLDSMANVTVAIGLIIYAVRELGLHPGLGDLALYGLAVFCGLAIHYSVLLLTASLTFWTIGSQGLEGGYFTLTEFSRLPREVFKGAANVVFVWILPAVVVSNVPARALLDGFNPTLFAWLVGSAALWLFIATSIFKHGLKRYSSASS
jgi:ABC-2 type transport system permease protein